MEEFIMFSLTEIINSFISLIEKIGPTNSLILAVLGFILLLGLMYLNIKLETHISHSPARDFFQYRKYKVTATLNTGEEFLYEIKAFGKINAIEKVAKKHFNYSTTVSFAVVKIE